MTRVVMVRHAEPLVDAGIPAAEWPLTDQGRENAGALGRRLADGSAPTTVWTSPERKARDTAAQALPSTSVRVRPELGEVTKPWYPTSGEVADAVASYLRGDVEGWEPRTDVIARLLRLTPVEADLRASERAVVVSHGVLITTWLDHAFGLEDPYSFWSNLRTPDAWELDLGERSLQRIA